MKRYHRFILLVALSLIMGSATAFSEVHWYISHVSLRSGESLHGSEIPVGKVIEGGYTEEETDNLGRITRMSWFWGAEKKSETLFQYAPKAKLAEAFETYAASGILVSRSRIQRNAAGERTRVEAFSPTGELTSYQVRTISPDSVEESTYTAEGKRTRRLINYYSAAGIRIRQREYPQENIYYESEYDQGTGVTLSQTKVVNGGLELTVKYSYNSYNDKTREDLYDSKGVWFGEREFSAWLKLDERYKFADGSTQETKSTYDENRWLKSATFSRNGQLICTFTYDRLPTGQVKRTLAVGSDGTLFAEYPDLLVDKVDQTGHPVDNADVGIIQRKGNWW